MTLKSNKKRIALVLTIQEIKTIKEIARKEGLSFSDKIRRILDDYLKEHLNFLKCYEETMKKDIPDHISDYSTLSALEADTDMDKTKMEIESDSNINIISKKRP